MMKVGTMHDHILVPDIVCVAWEKVFMWFARSVTRLAESGSCRERERERETLARTCERAELAIITSVGH